MSKETIEAMIEETQARLLELQSEAEQTLSRARWLLIQAADEVRQIRTQVEKDNLLVYTEKEAAAKLRIGWTTLRHLRTAKDDLPHFRVGSSVLYSNLHLQQIIERLENKKAEKAEKSARSRRP
jgi:predicted transcriptional regulator